MNPHDDSNEYPDEYFGDLWKNNDDFADRLNKEYYSELGGGARGPGDIFGSINDRARRKEKNIRLRERVKNSGIVLGKIIAAGAILYFGNALISYIGSNTRIQTRPAQETGINQGLGGNEKYKTSASHDNSISFPENNNNNNNNDNTSANRSNNINTKYISNNKKNDNNNISILTQKISDLEGQIASLTQENKGLEAQVETYKSDLKNAGKQNDKLSHEYTSIENEYYLLKKENKSLQTKLNDANAESKRLDSINSKLEDKISSLEARINQTSASADTSAKYQDQIDRLQNSNNDLMQKLSDAREAYASEKSINTGLNQKVSGFQASISDLKKSISEYEGEVNKNNSEISSYKNTIAGLENKINDQANTISTLRAKLDSGSRSRNGTPGTQSYSNEGSIRSTPNPPLNSQPNNTATQEGDAPLSDMQRQAIRQTIQTYTSINQRMGQSSQSFIIHEGNFDVYLIINSGNTRIKADIIDRGCSGSCHSYYELLVRRDYSYNIIKDSSIDEGLMLQKIESAGATLAGM